MRGRVNILRATGCLEIDEPEEDLHAQLVAVVGGPLAKVPMARLHGAPGVAFMRAPGASHNVELPSSRWARLIVGAGAEPVEPIRGDLVVLTGDEEFLMRAERL